MTVIEAGPTFLGLEEPEAGAALRPHLEADGIMLMIGDPCVAVEQPMMGPSRERSAVVVHLKSGADGTRRPIAGGHRPPPQRGGVARSRARTDGTRLVEGGPGDARSAARRLRRR